MKIFVTYFSLIIVIATICPASETKDIPKGMVSTEITFEEVEGASGYEIEIKSENFFKKYQSRTPLFNVIVPMARNKYRVRVKDDRNVYSAWSESEEFVPKINKVDLKRSYEEFPLEKTINGFKAHFKIKWYKIDGAKSYQFFLFDLNGNPLWSYETKNNFVNLKTTPGKYKYNVKAKYSGDVVSDFSEYEPEIEITGQKLPPPKVSDRVNKLKPMEFDVENTQPIKNKAVVEFSYYLSDEWIKIEDNLFGNKFNTKSYKKPGQYKVKFYSTLKGFVDSDPIEREFQVKPPEKDLQY